jgi:hypothetical protein
MSSHVTPGSDEVQFRRGWDDRHAWSEVARTAVLEVASSSGGFGSSRAALIPHTGDMPTAASDDAQCMAAAADRHPGDVLERVSPELVLVDAALAEEMRRRLDVPDDALDRIGTTRIEPRLSVHVAEVGVGADVENSALAGGELPPAPAAALEVAHHDVGIEDLIVLPEDGSPSVPPAPLVAPEEGVMRLVASPKETVAERERLSGLDDPISVPAEDRAEPRGSYPMLPSPPSEADEEDVTAVVRRHIRHHPIEPERPAKRRRRRLLSVVSLFAALSSMAIFAVDVQLGVSELPHWLPS